MGICLTLLYTTSRVIPSLTMDGIEGFDLFESVTLVFAGGFVPVDGAGNIILLQAVLCNECQFGGVHSSDT